METSYFAAISCRCRLLLLEGSRGQAEGQGRQVATLVWGGLLAPLADVLGMSIGPACHEERRGLLLSSEAPCGRELLVGMLVDVILCPCGPIKAQQSVMGVVKLIKETLLGEAVGTTVREGTLLPASLECCLPRVQPSSKPLKPGPPASEKLNG